MKSNKMVKNVVLLMSLTLLSKFIGFFREQVMSFCYGASIHTDAYVAAYDIPKILFSLIAASLATTYIPMYNRVLEEKGQERANAFTNNVINLTFLVGLVVSILAFAFMEPIVKVFAFGFKGEVFRETVVFTRIMLAGYIFSGVSSVMSSFLQNKGDFFVSGITGIPYNMVAIASMLLSVYADNIYILPMGASLALLSQYLIQLPKSFKLGYKPMPILDVRDGYIRDMLLLVAPVLVSTSVSQINRAVDKALASTLVVGSMSSLNYSNRLMGFLDRKSTRLNSSHANISYAVFCLKKKTSHCASRRLPSTPTTLRSTPASSTLSAQPSTSSSPPRRRVWSSSWRRLLAWRSSTPSRQ